MSRWLHLFICAVALALGFGCVEDPAQAKTASEPELTRQYRQQSLTVLVSVSETNITTAGRIRLMMDIQTPAGTEVAFPQVGSFIEPFSLSGHYMEPPQTLPNGKILHRQVWELVPSTPGKTTFESMSVSAGRTTLATDPITVQVESILPAGWTDLQIKDIAAPIALLPEQERKQRLWRVVFGIALAAALGALMVRLCNRPKTIIATPPHEVALQALDNLPMERMPCLHELSRILIEYLTGRYQLPITGKTTREIIPLLPKERLLGLRPRLIEFIETGELIRFSNRVPERYMEEAELYIREFIEATTPKEQA